MSHDDFNPTGEDGGTAVADAESSSLLEDLGADVPQAENLDMLLDVNLKISVELGRAQLKFRDVLNLSTGSVVERVMPKLPTSKPADSVARTPDM